MCYNSASIFCVDRPSNILCDRSSHGLDEIDEGDAMVSKFRRDFPPNLLWKSTIEQIGMKFRKAPKCQSVNVESCFLFVTPCKQSLHYKSNDSS